MDKTSTPDVYAVDFPVKPGETRVDLSYTVPYTGGAAYAGKIVTKDDDSYLISANGVTLQGDNLNDLGLEPRTQAHIYGFTGGAAYKIVLTGTAQAAPPENADTSDSDSGQRIEQIMPRIYGQAKPILALALGILALAWPCSTARRPQPKPRRPMSAVAVDGVWKFYGDFPALRDVRLEAAPGSCLALIGRNGAGKTTLLRIIAGFSRPGRGQVRILGNPPRETQTRQRIGFIGHGISVYDDSRPSRTSPCSAGFTAWPTRAARPSNGWSVPAWSA